jgi:hypothetical protein
MKARRQKCHARISNGSRQCERWAINGSTVCATHGGGAPQVKKSAKERLAELIEPALEGLHTALKSGEIPSIVKAAQIVLDRTGYHPSQSLELTGKIQNENLLPVERLSFVCKRLIAAELDEGFVISTELEDRLLSEIPPLKIPSADGSGGLN